MRNQKKKNIFSTINRWWRTYHFNRKFSNAGWLWPWRDIQYGVSNLVFYFKVIWNTRDWDWSGVLELLDAKLSRMEDLIRDHGNHLYHLRDADNIHKTRLAIRRILDDDYHENLFKHHEEKWGETSMSFTPCNDGTDCSILNMDKANANTAELKEQERKEYLRLIRAPDKLKQQDLEYVTMMLRKYLFHWWD